MEPNLYAYRYPRGIGHAHEIQLLIKNYPHLTDHWQVVKDEITGRKYKVRAADCGARCHCAAEAKLLA